MGTNGFCQFKFISVPSCYRNMTCLPKDENGWCSKISHVMFRWCELPLVAMLMLATRTAIDPSQSWTAAALCVSPKQITGCPWLWSLPKLSQPLSQKKIVGASKLLPRMSCSTLSWINIPSLARRRLSWLSSGNGLKMVEVCWSCLKLLQVSLFQRC